MSGRICSSYSGSAPSVNSRCHHSACCSQRDGSFTSTPPFSRTQLPSRHSRGGDGRGHLIAPGSPARREGRLRRREARLPESLFGDLDRRPLNSVHRTASTGYCERLHCAAIITIPSTSSGESTMEFVQILEFKTSKFDEIDAALQEYRAEARGGRRADAGRGAPVQRPRSAEHLRGGRPLPVVRSGDGELEPPRHRRHGSPPRRPVPTAPPQFRNLDLVTEMT